MQTAAEDAVEPVPQQTMLVAVAPSTGDLLAVAQNGAADARRGARAGRPVPARLHVQDRDGDRGGRRAAAHRRTRRSSCPGSTVIGGRPVPNADRFALGTVPLRTAFARSCNTTFAELGSRLGPDSLPAAALRLGLGADYAMPALTTITGSVPAAPDPVQRAENGFGQGQVLASPLGMALVAATVARGAPVVPQLIRDRPTEVLRPADPPDPAALDQVRPMMRAVVTEGTATRLAGLGEVFGKTGTAEYTDDGRAHGWFVGYRGDVAFAVLVVDGGSSAAAVEVAAAVPGAPARLIGPPIGSCRGRHRYGGTAGLPRRLPWTDADQPDRGARVRRRRDRGGGVRRGRAVEPRRVRRPARPARHRGAVPDRPGRGLGHADRAGRPDRAGGPGAAVLAGHGAARAAAARRLHRAAAADLRGDHRWCRWRCCCWAGGRCRWWSRTGPGQQRVR